MRIFSYLLVLIGILMFAHAGYDEYQGVTTIQAPRSLPEVVTKASRPEDFRGAMAYHWYYAFAVLIAGIIVYMIDRGLERADPMSPDFAGNKALDDWSDALNKQEEEGKKPKP
jgi:hypothetical protein